MLLLHGLGATKASLLRHRRGAQPPLPRPRARPARASAAPRKPRARRPTARAFFARAVIGVMDALGIERAHLVGNSMGGRVALEVGPASTRTASAASRCSAPRVAFVRRGWHRLVRLLRARSSACSRTRSAAAGSRASSGRCSPTATSSTRAWPTSSSTSSSASTARAGARLAFLASRARDLPRAARSAATASTRGCRRCEPPALFVWGSHDKLIPPGFSRHVERWLPERRADRPRGLRPRAAGRAPGAHERPAQRFFARIDALGGRGARCESPPRLRLPSHGGHR